jgi:DNA polymerase III delta subunit
MSSRIETVYVVSEPQPTVEESVRQLAQRLDKNLKDLVTVFQEASDQLWTAGPASHTVTPVPFTERRPA